MKNPRKFIYEIEAPFQEHWSESGVKDAYLEWVDERIYQLIDNLYTYDPYQNTLTEYKASVEMLAYTTTELLAQFCAGGFRWSSSDKARFLSPTVDLEAIVRSRAKDDRGHLGEYFESVKMGVWGFLEVSEYTKSWLEVKNLNIKQISYLLWSAKKALTLIRADERIPGFTDLALLNLEILDGYCKCESPIESILYMQLVVNGLRPPKLQNQFKIGPYYVNFAIPSGRIAIECDNRKHYEPTTSAERDNKIAELDWVVIRLPYEKILMDPSYCSALIHNEYPWSKIDLNKKEN